MPLLTKKPKFKVGTTSGLYGIARGEEIASLIKKVGYALTRGTSAIEISGDVPHEVDYTEGKEIRYIAEKQGIDLLLHGSLTVPMCIPERVQWREAQDHMEKSIKSAVFGGCKYVDFHACLHFWLEMLTYTGQRLEIIMSDCDGNFIHKILSEDKKLREWFVQRFWERYSSMILGNSELSPIYHRAELEAMKKRQENVDPETVSREQTERVKELIEEKLCDVLAKKDYVWFLKERGDYTDAYEIVAHWMFFNKDPIWIDMVKVYKDVLDKYGYQEEEEWFKSNSDPKASWLEKTIKEAEERGDKNFKEFYYAVVGSKFLQGHMLKLCDWMDKELPKIIEDELKVMKVEDEKGEVKKLKETLKNLSIAIEMPDARDPTYAGRYILWRPKQIYVAIKHTREKLKELKNPYSDKVFILIDFEHIATQGVDPLHELEELMNVTPDLGKLILSVHSNYPSPLHSHKPIEIGDIQIYRLLWTLKQLGMGSEHEVYLIFERGGFQDPFKDSITALKVMTKFLEENVAPEKLPPEFFGVSATLPASEQRQWVNVFHHALDPLKGLLKIPEEEHTFLGRAAIEEGKKPEEWKKEEYR